MIDKSVERRHSEPTARELEIIELLARGKSNKQIAIELGISVRTVEAHRCHVMQKLRVRSVVDLVYYAMDHGIIPQRQPWAADDRIVGVPEEAA